MPEDNTANPTTPTPVDTGTSAVPQPLPSSSDLPDPLAQQSPFASTTPDVGLPQPSESDAPVGSVTPDPVSPPMPVQPQPEPMVENVSQPQPIQESTPVSEVQNLSMPEMVVPAPDPVGSVLPPLDMPPVADMGMTTQDVSPMPTPVIDAGMGSAAIVPDAQPIIPGITPGQSVPSAIPQPQPIVGTEMNAPDLSGGISNFDATTPAAPPEAILPMINSSTQQLPAIPEPQVTVTPGEKGGILSGKNRMLYIVIAVLLVAVIVAASIILYQLTN